MLVSIILSLSAQVKAGGNKAGWLSKSVIFLQTATKYKLTEKGMNVQCGYPLSLLVYDIENAIVYIFINDSIL